MAGDQRLGRYLADGRRVRTSWRTLHVSEARELQQKRKKKKRRERPGIRLTVLKVA